MAFVPLINPGLHSTNLRAALTSAQIAHATLEHDSFCEEWKEYIATDTTLQNQLVNAIDNLYLKNLLSCVTRYISLTILTLWRHLYNMYARLMPVESDANNQNMKDR